MSKCMSFRKTEWEADGTGLRSCLLYKEREKWVSIEG
jgi:hypothetical protein